MYRGAHATGGCNLLTPARITAAAVLMATIVATYMYPRFLASATSVLAACVLLHLGCCHLDRI